VLRTFSEGLQSTHMFVLVNGPFGICEELL